MRRRRGLFFGAGLPWVNPQTDTDRRGGLWFRIADLIDGAVASFTSHDALAQVLAQGTGTAQPVKAATGYSLTQP